MNIKDSSQSSETPHPDVILYDNDAFNYFLTRILKLWTWRTWSGGRPVNEELNNDENTE